MAVIESAEELNVAGEQHAVSEHVARHVADPDHGEMVVWLLTPSSRKCRLTDSDAARGDPHLVVVVADGAARGKCIIQPEAVLL